MVAALEVQDLSTQIRTRKGFVKAVDGVSIYVDEGETIALVGETGSGTSEAMLSTVQLLPKPSARVSGRVILDGENILQNEANGAAMRSIRGKKISIIFGDPKKSLNPTMSIGRQITEVLELHLEMEKQAAGERAVELLQMVGIPDAENMINEVPRRFADGMRQRIMIAMAFACNPDVVIADEPTTIADVTVQTQLLNLIKELVTRLNSALVMVTRDLGVVARYARRMYVMYAGRIIESGPSGSVFSHPCHPYTLGLLQSLPRLCEHKSTKKLVPIDGMPPDLTGMPPHCPFLPRCARKMERCEMDPWPDLRPVGEEHFTRCYVDIRETP